MIWKFKTLQKIESSPVVAGDKVLITSGDGRIYLLDLKTGIKIFAYDLGSPIYSTPAVIGDLIVVAANDGNVYGFGKKQKSGLE